MTTGIRFLFEGRCVVAREGDTVAAALIANGVRVFGRSSKFHRPRGYRCGMGHCSACAMRVDGLPGVRTCVTPAREGLVVEREHAWPTAGLDVLRAAELASPLTPPGFYYRRFRRSPQLWRVLERGLAQVAGQGAVPSPEAVARLARARCERRDVAVLVVGGGVAGLSAALAAADAGAEVLLVEQDDRLGGRLGDRPGGRACAAVTAETRSGPATRGAGTVADLAERVSTRPGIEAVTAAEAIGWYEEGIVAVDRRPDLLLVRPAAVVLATGGYDRGLPFAGWDLPGVMQAAGALRLWERHGVRPGSRAVVVTAGDHGYDAAARLHAAGVEVACVADCRPPQAIRQELQHQTAALGATLVRGARGARAHGFDAVRALTLLAPDRTADGGRGRSTLRFACDLVCVAAGARPADDLAYQATADGSFVLRAGGADTGGRGADRALPAGLWLAGLAAGATALEDAVAQGTAAGSAAARASRATSDPA